MASCYYVPLKNMGPTPSRYWRSTTPQTAVLMYEEANISGQSVPMLPHLPYFNDYQLAFRFFNSLKGLHTGPHWFPVPHQVDDRMFLTVGLGTRECIHKDKNLCLGPDNTAVVASLNNVSFILPTDISILHAWYYNVNDIYTTDFPNEPPYVYDFVNLEIGHALAFSPVSKGTKVKKLKYNSTVEIVFQNTALIALESHPIHLHGFSFYVLAQGFGNYEPSSDYKKFNLENPHLRNTITIPMGGWVAIRFIANNPGVWYMHCHLEVHVPFGLATAFIVENGPTPSSKLPPHPVNIPSC